ncbi:MAG: GNAT family N-acetyltransferase [Bacteroidales bacterium]|nr:GNAT family N-acetyltransferase [Bacteroidales bacterium]
MKIKKATEFDDSVREKVSEVFVEAFLMDHLGQIVKNDDDKKALITASAHMFNLEHVYFAMIDGEIAGMIGCMPKNDVFIRPRKKEFMKHFGTVKGFIIGFMFGHYLKATIKKCPSVKTTENTATVEMVATHPKHTGKGVATALLNHVHAFPNYDTFLLEVVDTNENAVRLYKKFGYEEAHRRKARGGEQKSGINNFLYLKYSKNQ